MRHSSEEDLILAYFEEASDRTLEHLRACGLCRRELERLREVMDATRSLAVPDPGADYGRRVWRRLEPRLRAEETAPVPEAGLLERLVEWWRRAGAGWAPGRQLGWALATLVLVAGAFLFGRLGAPAPAVPQVATSAGTERVLLVALGVHLERSRVLLRELDNGGSEITAAKLASRADRLLDDNRLYRLAAGAAGEKSAALALAELERVLVDLSHLDPDDAALADVRQRQRRRGLLWKLEVLATTVEDRRDAPWASREAIGDDHETSI